MVGSYDGEKVAHILWGFVNDIIQTVIYTYTLPLSLRHLGEGVINDGPSMA